MNWLFFAIFAAISFGLYNLFTKISADKFSPTIVLMIITGTAFFVSLIASFVAKLSGQTLNFPKNLIYLPILSGIFYGTAVIFNVIMWSRGAPISVGSPVVVGGTTLVAATLGFLLLKEPITTAKIIGAFLVLSGLFVLVRS